MSAPVGNARAQFLAILCLLVLCGSVLAVSIHTDLPANPDGTRDTKYPLGNKPVVDLTCDDSAAPALTGRFTGDPYTGDVRQYVGGASAAAAVLSLETISGDDATTEGWSISSAGAGDNLTHPGTGAGAGSFRVVASFGGNDVPCPTVRNWSYEVPPGLIVKWHPGHYLMADNGSSLAQRKTYCDEIEELDHIKGLHVRYFWAQMETTQGTYNFNDVRELVNYCGAMGKRIILEVWWRKFGGSSANGIVPTYVQNNGGANAKMYATGDGYAVRLWDSTVADRIIALFEALALEFDGDDYFEMVMGSETSAGAGATSVSGYSAANYVTQAKRIITEARPDWTRTQFRLVANYLTGGTNAQMIDLINHAKTNFVTILGPDICKSANCTDSTAQDVMDGGIGGHDYRGEVAIATNAEMVSYNHAMGTLYPRAVNTLKVNYISWLRNTWLTTETDWVNEIKPYLASNPTTVSTCPSTLACDTD